MRALTSTLDLAAVWQSSVIYLATEMTMGATVKCPGMDRLNVEQQLALALCPGMR